MSRSAASRYLFVYGTLRRDPANEMFHLLARNAAFVSEGSVQGRLFDLGEYPGLVPSDDPKESVSGEVYEIQPLRLKETLVILDDYEGCGASDPEPHEYRREKISVRLPGGKSIAAWAFVLSRTTRGLKKIPSGDFIQWRASRSGA